MDKQQYITSAFEIIRAKNLATPFNLDPGSKVPDLEKYLNSLKSAYLNSIDPRIEKLFHDKIEALKAL
ncbi:hypothetical protein HX017_09015 [Myroides marinus]|jgi:hypothetical protein|uniref:Uncharacterized protein n=1 Tax=Myroides marinus TaxID=703342 RepID=A0A1H6Y5D5_9FLAO|nr:hypothetical protein [Myroides marinus]MDR0194180.1 hypothetical protein [Myroides sp.]KUF39033.1 hypothetical protein AS361_04090 [Myroides marinus]MDM1346767.1 hypothetical protein [Myroides marinus]MDM1350444.1 hypothetical protein [Myroides marinus]MDM1354246.1 hypothetical protein [Myroides marinus]